MANIKTNFNTKIIKEIIGQYIKRIPLIDSNKQPIIEINDKDMEINIKVNILDEAFGVYNCLTQIQNLVFYELSEILDDKNIKVNVEVKE